MSSTSDQPVHDDDKGVGVGVDVHARFDRPGPLHWKGATLVTLLAVLCWLVFYLGPGAKPQPKIIYTPRYSKEFKFRPAVSLVITKRIKDGGIRLWGAFPT